jgi:hypothetical protein
MNDAEHGLLGERATIQVKAIYGWGWLIDGEPRFKVPEPFAVLLDGSEGQVQGRTGQSDQRRPTVRGWVDDILAGAGRASCSLKGTSSMVGM